MNYMAGVLPRLFYAHASCTGFFIFFIRTGFLPYIKTSIDGISWRVKQPHGKTQKKIF